MKFNLFVLSFFTMLNVYSQESESLEPPPATINEYIYILMLVAILTGFYFKSIIQKHKYE